MKSQGARPRKKPWTINLAKRWTKKDRDQSKLIKSINQRSIVLNARGVLGEKSGFSPSMHLWSCHTFALYFCFCYTFFATFLLPYTQMKQI